MPHHRGFRGGRGGWGGPVIIEEYIDPNDLLIGAEKTIAFHLGPPPAVAAVPAPLSTMPDESVAASAPIPVAAPAPKFDIPPPAPKKNLAPAGGALAGGALGFAVGGPIGAAVGLVAGYFGGKVASKPATPPVIMTTPPKTPTVQGDFGCDHIAGWSPHGDEGMR